MAEITRYDPTAVHAPAGDYSMGLEVSGPNREIRSRFLGDARPASTVMIVDAGRA